MDTQDENCYVYILLDPRVHPMKPFYVGMGSGNRKHSTVFDSSKNSKLKQRKIEAIRRFTGDIDIPIFMWVEAVTRQEAFNIERELIARWGRICDRTGILSNHTDGGEGTVGWKASEENKHNMRVAQRLLRKQGKKKTKRVVQYDLAGNFIREWDAISDAARNLSTTPETIASACKNRTSKTACGFMFRFSDDLIDEEKLKIDSFVRKRLVTSVIQKDLQGVELQTWESYRAVVGEIGGSIKNLTSAISKNLPYMGFRWEVGEQHLIETSDDGFLVQAKKNRKVIQFDIDGNYVNVFDNAEFAATYVSTSREQITRVCRQQKGNCMGYQWRYEDANDIIDNKIATLIIKQKASKLLQKNLDGSIEKVWSSQIEAITTFGLDRDKLYLAIKNRLIYFDFLWEKGEQHYIDIKPTNIVTKARLPIKIKQFEADGSFVKEWDTILTASKSLLINARGIAKACKNKQLAGGFAWRYADSGDIKNDKIKPLHMTRKIKSLSQYDNNMVLIKTYKSVDECVKSNPHLTRSSLRYASDHRIIHKGFYWKLGEFEEIEFTNQELIEYANSKKNLL